MLGGGAIHTISGGGSSSGESGTDGTGSCYKVVCVPTQDVPLLPQRGHGIGCRKLPEGGGRDSHSQEPQTSCQDSPQI